ncbi:MAG: DNA-processing protein DprA, partial [Flavobacteriales bacterium]
NMNLSQEKIISIVGTRNVTQYGKDFCNNFVKSLAPLNPLVISGLAYGVDINAHRAAYKNGMQTVAALAHGLDRVYPAMHKKDVAQMMNNGGILTDFISGT